MTTPVTKEGAHGTLRRYGIRYRNFPAEPYEPEFIWHCWAYSRECALDKFASGQGGWEAVAIASVLLGHNGTRRYGEWETLAAPMRVED